MPEALKDHWEKIFQTKRPEDVSWTQESPTVSLEYIHKYQVPKDARIIDVGGGDSKLVDVLWREGFKNLTVLDISAAALERAKQRLGKDAENIHWIVCDVLDFRPSEKYDVWHDRAAFHFQTDPDKIERYLEIVTHVVEGMVIVGTFSTDGPKKCSGLEVKQYDENGMKAAFESHNFKNIECQREDHITPAGVVQNFLFCSFKNL